MKFMGKNSRSWKHIKTNEDLKQIKEFEDLYYRNFKEKPFGSNYIIPNKIHFVWLGPKEYPKSSLENLLSWRNKHPDWDFIFWTDQVDLNLPSGIEIRRVDDVFLSEMGSFYNKTQNYGERSDIVRLLALKAEGGVYVDHDMECRASFDNFHKSYPFYGGLLTPGNPIIKSAAVIRNSIIGSIKDHPILSRALELTKLRWEEIEKEYYGQSMEMVKQRVVMRVFKAFHDAVLEEVKKPDFEGIIFPAGCFNQIEKSFGLYAHEAMIGSWFTSEMGEHERYLKQRLHKLMKRQNLLFAISFSLILLLLTSNIFLLWKVL